MLGETLNFLKLQRVVHVSFAEYHSKRNYVERVHATKNEALSKHEPFSSMLVHRFLILYRIKLSDVTLHASGDKNITKVTALNKFKNSLELKICYNCGRDNQEKVPRENSPTPSDPVV